MHTQPQESAQYSSTLRAPLIKNPAVRVPPPAILPQDIHPLPDNISDYMVYPFVLEQHVLAIESARRATLVAHAARREAYLRDRDLEKERRKREALRRVAPGFNPDAMLMPTRSAASPTGAKPTSPTSLSATASSVGHARSRSVMDDLVDHLAALDASSSASPTPNTQQ